jgi:hydrogenase maturation protease
MTMSAPTVRILVCGSADRGDDGAALAAIAHLLPTLSPEICARIEVRRCQQLDATDLIDVDAKTTCVVVDTAVGIEPGSVVAMPLADLVARASSVGLRSSHALPVDQVLLIAATLRGTIPQGTFIGIGGKWFGYGPRFSRAVKAGLEGLQAAILAELVRLTGADVLAPVASPASSTAPCEEATVGATASPAAAGSA